jgi:hypothetical protein
MTSAIIPTPASTPEPLIAAPTEDEQSLSTKIASTSGPPTPTRKPAQNALRMSLTTCVAISPPTCMA